MISILSGKSGTGKTRFLKQVTTELRAAGQRVAGVISPMIIKDGLRIGYDIIDLSTGERAKLARVWEEGVEIEGKFRFLPEGLDLASRALDRACNGEWDLVVVDEIGPLELRDRGFALWVRNLVTLSPPKLILVVRPWLVQQVVQKFGILDYEVVETGDQHPEIRVAVLDT